MSLWTIMLYRPKNKERPASTWVLGQKSVRAAGFSRFSAGRAPWTRRPRGGVSRNLGLDFPDAYSIILENSGLISDKLGGLA